MNLLMGGESVGRVSGTGLGTARIQRVAVGAFVRTAVSSLRVWMYVAAIAVRIPWMGQSLAVWHGWRQTQTAFTAQVFQTEGIDLLRPQVPIFGRPFVLVYELPLFQAMASGVASLGVGLEHALRWTSLFWFIVTALLLYAILVQVAGPRVAVAAELVFLFNPFGLFWSRASLIEYLATALALGCVIAALRWRDGGNFVYLGSSIFLGGIGAMVKATTVMVWMLPLVVLMLVTTGLTIETRVGPARSLRVRLLGLASIATSVLVAAFGWSAWADHLKGLSPLTAGSKTGSVLSENRAAWPHLLTGRQWSKPYDMVVNHQLGGILILFVVLFALGRTNRKLWWWSLALMPLVAVLAFPLQYREHEYYNAAVSPAIAALAGLAGITLLQSSWASRFPRLICARALLPLWMLMAIANGYQSIATLRLANSSISVRAELALPRELQANTQPGELIGGVGLISWSPVPFYEAHRRGAIMTSPVQARMYAQEFRSGGYHAILVGTPRQNDLRVLDGWAWIGAVSPHVLRFGDDRASVKAARVLSLSADTATAAFTDTKLLQGPSTLTCDGSAHRIPSTEGQMALWFARPNGQQHFWVNDELAALPVRGVAVVAAEAFAPGKYRSIRCLGGGSLDITRISSVH